MAQDSPDYMTVPQAAQHLGISDDLLRDLCQKRQIPSAKMGTRWILDRVLLDAWLREQMTAPLADAS